MTRTLFVLSQVAVVFACSILSGCGGRQSQADLSPRELLARGRYAEARAAVSEKATLDPEERAIIALSLVAENPSVKPCEKALIALTKRTSGVGAAAAARDMLELTFDIPQPVDSTVSLALGEVALGAVGLGPLAPAASQTVPVGAASRSLAVATLERVYVGYEQLNGTIATDRLLTIWNACFTLSGSTTKASNEAEAWILFRSIGGLAIVLFEADPDSVLTSVLLSAAVTVLENNPDIAIPARCDLSSPFDKLKMSLAHKRDLLGRLELAVAEASGCTRGTYAPKVR